MTTTPEPNAQMTWRIAPAGQLLSAEFDGQTVVYHTGAGHTHWISPVAAEVVYRLSQGSQNEAALYIVLSKLVSEEDLPMLAEALQETLEHLKNLTLIEPA